MFTPSQNNIYTAYLNNNDNNYTSVGHESRPLKDYPPEIRSFIEIQELKNILGTTTNNIDQLLHRIKTIENFLSSELENRLYNMEQLIQKMLTPTEELALRMTSDKEEVRKIADEVVQIKKAMGFGNA